MTADETRDLRPKPARRPLLWSMVALAAVVLVSGAAWWLRSPGLAAGPAAAASAPMAPPSALPPAPSPVAEAPQPEPPPAPQPLSAEGVKPALAELLGAKAVLSLLQSDDFVRRFVVSVDNLGRAHAPSMSWPVKPSDGRFAVVERDGGTFVNADNAQRYTPFVLLAEQVNTRAAVALYVRLLPLLQQAYEEAGYPHQRFHTRLINVIDHLLATPTAPELIPVQLTQVKGEVPSVRPWVRYEFADPAFESASAGHKIMLRVGAVNERRLKARLRELRAELVRVADTAAR